MSAPIAELIDPIKYPDLLGANSHESFACLLNPDRDDLRKSLLELQQQIAQYVEEKLKNSTYISSTTFHHPDYPDLVLPAQVRDFMGEGLHIAKTDINRGNDIRLLREAAPTVHYSITAAAQNSGESVNMGMLVFEGGDCQITLEERTVATHETVQCKWGDTQVFHYSPMVAAIDTRKLTTMDDFYDSVDERTDCGRLLLKMYTLLD